MDEWVGGRNGTCKREVIALEWYWELYKIGGREIDFWVLASISRSSIASFRVRSQIISTNNLAQHIHCYAICHAKLPFTINSVLTTKQSLPSQFIRPNQVCLIRTSQIRSSDQENTAD